MNFGSENKEGAIEKQQSMRVYLDVTKMARRFLTVSERTANKRI